MPTPLIKSNFEGRKLPTDAVALEIVLADLHAQIRTSAHRGDMGIVKQLLILSRIIGNLRDTIRAEYDGDITGTSRDIFIVGETDPITVEFDSTNFKLKVNYDDTFFIEGMHAVADEIFENPNSKIIIKDALDAVAKTKKTIAQSEGDAKAVEDFLRSIDKPPTQE